MFYKNLFISGDLKNFWFLRAKLLKISSLPTPNRALHWELFEVPWNLLNHRGNSRKFSIEVSFSPLKATDFLLAIGLDCRTFNFFLVRIKKILGLASAVLGRGLQKNAHANLLTSKFPTPVIKPSERTIFWSRSELRLKPHLACPSCPQSIIKSRCFRRTRFH